MLCAFLGTLCFVAALLVVRSALCSPAPPKPSAKVTLPQAAPAKPAAIRSEAASQVGDTSVRFSLVPSTGVCGANLPEPICSETDACSIKIVVMHRPTHDAARNKSGEYPYGWHLHGRKRLWEVRVQLHLKKVPRSKILFGLEMIPGPQTQSLMTKHVQGMILAGIRGIIGRDFYHTPGDDPATTEGECEPPTFAMPLWALDQIIESDPGQEPELTGNLDNVGHRRTAGKKGYQEAMDKILSNLSDQKIYTLCFWGVSQFIDANKWEFRGSGLSLDANKLCGQPPVFVVAYDLKDDAQGGATPGGPRKHYVSQKNYLFKVALWCAAHPPDEALLQELLQSRGVEASPQAQSSPRTTGDESEPWRVVKALMKRTKAWPATHGFMRDHVLLPLNALCDKEQALVVARRRRQQRRPLPKWVNLGQRVLGGCMGAAVP